MKESYGKADETWLIRASVDGDRLAFAEIVNRYRKMVARTVKGMLGDTVFAEDIGQEVFVKLYHSLSEFRGESKLATYIQRIAINFTLNEIKRRKRFFSLLLLKMLDLWALSSRSSIMSWVIIGSTTFAAEGGANPAIS